MGCVGVNSVQLGLSIPNFPAQWPYTFLGTGRIEGVGDLAALLIPTEWIWSQKSHFQEPFFSKVICEHSRKRLHREQWLNFHTIPLLTSVVFGLGISESNPAWTHRIVLATLSWNCGTIIMKWNFWFFASGVITNLEQDNLKCNVKWALGSITMNKAIGGNGIPVELFHILKDDAVKVLHSICQQIWKTQQWPQDWKR